MKWMHALWRRYQAWKLRRAMLWIRDIELRSIAEYGDEQ